MNGTHSQARSASGTLSTESEGPPPDLSERWSIAASAGAIVSAFIASACCVGPLVLALVGIGGGALLASFEPYRRYFTVVTLGLLGFGFSLQYRKPRPTANADGIACDCPTPRASKAGRVMLWVATVLVVGFLAFPYLAPLIWE